MQQHNVNDDDMRTVHDLKEAVHTWLTVDTSIAALQTGLRERRAFKQQLTDRILVLMRQMQVKNLEVADHQCVLKYKVTRVSAPLPQRVVQQRLLEHYASDPDAGQALARSVFSRDRVERVQLTKAAVRGGQRPLPL